MNPAPPPPVAEYLLDEDPEHPSQESCVAREKEPDRPGHRQDPPASAAPVGRGYGEARRSFSEGGWRAGA